MKAKNENFYIQYESLQHNNYKCKIHRLNCKECNINALGKNRTFDWNGVQNKERILKDKGYKFRRCTICFPSVITTQNLDEFNEKEFQELLEKKLDFTFRYLKREHDAPNKWKETKELHDSFKSMVHNVVSDIDRRYDFTKLTVKNRWNLLRVTRDQFIKFLRRYATIDPKVYESLRREIQENLNKSHFVNMMEEEDGLDKKILEDSIPNQKNEACSKLNSLISNIYANFGIISCNGRNHPFFCFCGFGGTQVR